MQEYQHSQTIALDTMSAQDAADRANWRCSLLKTTTMSALRKRKSSSSALVATNAPSSTSAVPSIEELERLGIEPSPSVFASFDVDGDAIVFRSLMTFTILHTLACAKSTTTTTTTNTVTTATTPASSAVVKRRTGRTPSGSAGGVGGEHGDQRVVLPAMAKVSLSSTVSWSEFSN
jgi:hypothetical protein